VGVCLSVLLFPSWPYYSVPSDIFTAHELPSTSRYNRESCSHRKLKRSEL
jgi:hypothetical protein